MSRRDFFKSLTSIYSITDLKRIQVAYWFSKNMHRPQKRDDGERYFEHPLRVAKTILGAGYDEVDTIITALLHDIVEDTYTPNEVIISLFGPSVWENVSLLSKKMKVLDPLTLELVSEAKKSNGEYYASIALAPKAVRLVKISDRLDNISDLDTFKPDRRERYIAETKDFVLPIADKTEPVIADKIREIINKF